MRVTCLHFFLILIFQMCFTANALDLSSLGLMEQSQTMSLWSQNQVSPLEASPGAAPISTQETVEDDDFEIWHESLFSLQTLDLILLSFETEKIHRGPYIASLDRPPSQA